MKKLALVAGLIGISFWAGWALRPVHPRDIIEVAAYNCAPGGLRSECKALVTERDQSGAVVAQFQLGLDEPVNRIFE